MSWFSDIFGRSQTGTTRTDSEQNATTSGQGGFGATGRAMDFATNLADRYNPHTIANDVANAGTPNQWQLGALNAYPGLMQSAMSISGTGIDPNRIAAFQSPYTQQVVDATKAQFDRSNAMARSQDQAYAAKAGVNLMGGTQGRGVRAFGDYTREAAQAPTIAGLYNQGFQSASDLAARDAALRSSALGTAGSLAGQAFNSGNTMWGNNWQRTMAPYQLTNQQMQGLATLAPFTGTYNSGASSGISSGTGNTTQTNTPSPFSVGRDLAGTIMSGMPMPAASGGRILSPYEEKANDPSEKLGRAFHAIRGMISRASGGGVGLKGFDTGGPAIENWATTVEPASQGYDWNGVGKKLQDQGKADQQQDAKGGGGDMGLGAAMAGTAQSLSNTIAQSQKAAQMRGFATGGAPSWDSTSGQPVFDDAPSDRLLPSYAGGEPSPTTLRAYNNVGTPYSTNAPVAAPNQAAAPAPSRPFGGWFQDGVWAGKAPTWNQRFGAMLMSPGDGPMAGAGKMILEWDQARRADAQLANEVARLKGIIDGKPTLDAQRMAQEAQLATGKINGVPTVSGRQVAVSEAQSPAHIRQMEAAAKLAETNSDKEFLLEQEKKKMEASKELALAQKRAELDTMFEYRKKMQEEEARRTQATATGTNPRRRWERVNTNATQSPMPPAADVPVQPSAPPLNAPTSTNRTSTNRTGARAVGTPDNPHSDKSRAGFGEFYKGSDGNIYRRGNFRIQDQPVSGGR